MPREIVIFNVCRMIFFTSNPLSSGLNYDVSVSVPLYFIATRASIHWKTNVIRTKNTFKEKKKT